MQIEVIIENTGERRMIEQGTQLCDLVKEVDHKCKYPVLCAMVNNKIEMLSYNVFRPKSIRFIDITHRRGYHIYITSLCFLLYKAVRDCFPQAVLTVEHWMVNGYYCKVVPVEENYTLPSQLEIARAVRERMVELVRQNIPFETKTIPVSDAFKLLDNEPIPYTQRMLKGLRQLYIDMHFLGGTPHLFDPKQVYSTGLLEQWDLRPFANGFLLQCPDPRMPEKIDIFQDSPKLFNIFQEHHNWAKLLHVSTIYDVNDIVHNHKENQLIQVSEALHEKKYASIADMIDQRRDKVRMVLLAGPSSSGKTTSCRRLAVQLNVLGFDVKQLSLDDYFLPREQTPRQPNGDYDFEDIEALNIPLLNEQLQQLFDGKEVKIPTYDFTKGAPYFSGKTLQLHKDTILIVEGIHALNPKLTADIDDELKFKIYVSALTQIAIDKQNIIRSNTNRLLRRIVRDNNFRSYSALATLQRWPSVRNGEHKHIFPYQENADVMFNSALLYELGILRPFAEPLLKMVPQDTEQFSEASQLLDLLALIEPIQTKFIPPTSILREFLGDSSFEY